MEHWYNNPVVNGFCEMIVESMINSKLTKSQLDDTQKSIDSNLPVKLSNSKFKFKSYLKLRNLFFLLILLKNLPFLRQHRYHFTRHMERKNDKNESFFDSFDRQKQKFSYRKKMARKFAKSFSKEAQLYDILRSKNDAIIQQNLDRIMVANSGNDQTRFSKAITSKSAREIFFEDIVEEVEEAVSSSGDEEETVSTVNSQVYNLKKTRFI